jgi:hypothetical protein
MTSPKVLNIIEEHVREWKSKKKLPAPDNKRVEEEDSFNQLKLFNKLKKANLYSRKTNFWRGVIHRDIRFEPNTFNRDRYRLPSVRVYPEDAKLPGYEYKFNLEEAPIKMVSKENHCTEEELNQSIREYSNYLSIHGNSSVNGKGKNTTVPK